MIDIRKQAQLAIELLKQADAVGQCSVSSGKALEFNVDGGQFSLMRTLFSSSIGITAYKDGKKGTAATNDISDIAVKAAVEDALRSAESGVPDEAYGIAEYQPAEKFVDGELEPDRDKLFDRVEEFVKTVENEYPSIILEQVIVTHSAGKNVLLNTNGVDFESEDGGYGFDAMFSAHEGELSSSFLGCGITTNSLDTPFIELGTMRENLDAVTKQIHTQPLEGKFTGTMLLPPDSLRDFIDMLASNFACDGTLIDGTSPWRDMLGKQVADEKLTVSIAPLDSRIVSGQRYTGDGYKSENYDFIKDGVLNSFMLSRYGAKKTGFERAKNSSFSLIVKNGDKSLNDIIASIDKGIMVGRFSGGNPGTNGDFSGVAKNSFIIENGAVGSALSETMISGNLAEMFRNVTAISAETVCDGSSCLPWLAVKGITVSGK